MTLELFLQGIAETLAEAPVPEGTENRSDLIHGVGWARGAHLQALVDMAYDLETQAGRDSN